HGDRERPRPARDAQIAELQGIRAIRDPLFRAWICVAPRRRLDRRARPGISFGRGAGEDQRGAAAQKRKAKLGPHASLVSRAPRATNPAFSEHTKSPLRMSFSTSRILARWIRPINSLRTAHVVVDFLALRIHLCPGAGKVRPP